MEAKKFDSIRELKGISEKTMTEHYKLYEGYVNKVNEILEKLKVVDKTTANQTFSDIRSLAIDYSFAIGGVKNHEMYFEILGGEGGKPSGKLLRKIEKDFGSFDKWQEELSALALASRGWAFMYYDFDQDRLINGAGDAQNTFPIWNAKLLVPIDVYEHAYYLDYKTNRAEYVKAFFNNIDWTVLEKLADRMPFE